MYDEKELVELKLKVDKNTYNTLLSYQLVTKKDMEYIAFELVRTGAKEIKAAFNRLPHTNLNQIIEVHGLSE